MIAIALILGAVVGSFLNVVIVRLPMGKSVVWPGSHCGGCGKPIRWFDNIPILSFLWLRGRCRQCSMPISWRYPAVEATTAALFALAACRFGWTLDVLSAWIMLGALVAIAAIDLEHQIIPDAISVPAIAAGLILAFLAPSRSGIDALLGVAVGAGIPFAIVVLSRGGMGGGDIRLGALMGAFLGWRLAVLGIFLGVVLGGVLATVLLVTGLRGRKDRIPFGPFLAAGAVLSLFVGDALMRWYWSGFEP
jgi:leader peptidase (prepilin peptidase)/N-methyltransferase